MENGEDKGTSSLFSFTLLHCINQRSCSVFLYIDTCHLCENDKRIFKCVSASTQIMLPPLICAFSFKENLLNPCDQKNGLSFWE